MINSGILQQITAGHVEGEFIGTGITLSPSRLAFVQDEAYVEFIDQIEKWQKRIGDDLLAAAKDRNQAVRFQRLGLRSMTVVENMLQLPQFEGLRNLIQGAKKGTVGIGHADTGKPEKPLDGNFLTTTGGADQGRAAKTPSEKPAGSKDPSSEERPEHIPLGVKGPKGNPRSLVKGNSTGLVFSHEFLEGNPDLWVFDATRGLLTFNIRHPLWVMADEAGDLATMRFQEYVAIMALSMEMLPAHSRPEIMNHAEIMTPFMTLWITGGDKFRKAEEKDK